MVAQVELHRHYGPQKLLAIGQDLYKQQKYTEALEALTAALQASRDTEITLAALDRRAATYLKLDNLQAALKDGEAMLRADKTHAKGYIRTGAALEKKEQREIALKIYARGLKLVSSKDPLYNTLRDQHSKLVMALSPPKAADMFTMLPPELLDMVFSYITFNDTCRCLRVSKHWNEFLRTAPFIWRHLDFSNIPARRSVNLQTVRKYLKWADLDVRSICLKGVELQSSKFLKELAVKCKTLESLTVLSGGELRQSLMDCASRARALRFLILDIPLHGDTVRHIMNVATKLETASFAEITKMTPLSTYEYEKWDQNDFPKLLSFQVSSWNVKHEFAPLPALCPPASNLKVIRFNDRLGTSQIAVNFNKTFFRDCASLEEIAMRNVDPRPYRRDGDPEGPPYIPLPLTIRRLALYNCKAFTGETFLPKFDHTLDFSKLTDIVLRETWHHETQPQVFTRLLDCASRGNLPPAPLDVLDLSVGTWSNADVLALITADRLQKLRCLRLQCCQTFDDDLAGIVAGTLKQLAQLSIQATKVTGVGIKKLVQGLPHLARLDLSDCQELGYDAVEWARTRGIKVGFSRSL